MKIELSSQQAFCLAEDFAKVILGRVTEMHFWTTDHVFHTVDAPCHVKAPSRSFDEVRDAIRSLPAGSYERLEFVRTVGWHFKRLRSEQIAPYPKWQDYLASVKRNNADRVPTPFVSAQKMEAA